MDDIRKKLYQKSQIMTNLLIRNGFLLFNYIKIRAGILFLVSIFLIVISKNNELDGISSILYGVQPDVERKTLPIMWLFFLMTPILIVGDSQEKLLRKDYPIVSRVSLATYFFSTIVLSLLIEIVFFTVMLLINRMLFQNMFFFIYICIFSFVFLITFQLISSIFLNNIMTIMLFFGLLIVDVYIPYSAIIDGTMLSRFDSNYLFKNYLILLLIFIVINLLTMIKIKKIDFVERRT
ncbi:hypothetical protein ACWOFR_01220 [Carnobacterium gallinarum]|uniref:hypothetical protein n=1 Tax=Carnobacterium gallinarum TaxID=2749 RepID=UPI00068DC8F0|nr:hypothetical protein [Carnobacterium gallinarum]